VGEEGSARGRRARGSYFISTHPLACSRCFPRSLVLFFFPKRLKQPRATLLRTKATPYYPASWRHQRSTLLRPDAQALLWRRLEDVLKSLLNGPLGSPAPSAPIPLAPLRSRPRLPPPHRACVPLCLVPYRRSFCLQRTEQEEEVVRLKPVVLFRRFSHHPLLSRCTTGWRDQVDRSSCRDGSEPSQDHPKDSPSPMSAVNRTSSAGSWCKVAAPP
jgi:hypothetical protein